jgi:NAD(P)H dehydrogenase (quinone)
MSVSMNSRVLVTGATGQLGRLVVQALLRKLPASQIAAGVRNPDSDAAKSFGVELRTVDYDKPETLGVAFVGIDRLLLISSNEVGGRLQQHRHVIDSAKAAGVTLIAYTSLLHADRSPLGLAEEHRQTEAALKSSGVPFTILRNGWYTENYLAALPTALAHGALLGSAGDGLIASASRADYAEAAAIVLASDQDQAGRVYELAGDEAYTLTQLAAEAAHRSGKALVYKNLSLADYKAVLIGAGLPEAIAALFADFDAGAAQGALAEDGRELSRLIGRPTTPWTRTLADSLRG